MEGKDVIKNERFLLQSHAAWVSLNEMTSCNPELKITSDQLESAVEKLKVPLNRLHPDGMGGVVVGPERKGARKRMLCDDIRINPGGCWEWTGYKFLDGYGGVTIGANRRICILRAHRVVYSLLFSISKEMLVCHHCDNRICVNPFHLYLGTSKENSRDRVVRGRSNAPCGTSKPNSLFSNKDIQDIRIAYSKGNETMKGIALRYGANTVTIFAIIHRKSWKHVK